MSPPNLLNDAGAIVRSNTSNGPSWQIDIPGLAELVLRFGADGLKRLQLSGVDVHTIGCMFCLGELTPATVAFRSELQKVRAIQRTKTWWIHEAVQYGSGVSFVVDELLKFRAGENVLALFTAIISILEESSIKVISLLFDKSSAGVHNTPSIAQLENIRSVCLNLARDMDLKDRLIEIHHWLTTQISQKEAASIDHEKAIPSTATIVDLVNVLKDISIQSVDRRSRLAYYGSCGAAWLILYAKDILGLSVCLVFQNSNTIPLSGEFSDADVLLFPQASDTTDVFKHIERPSDVIMVTSAPRFGSLSTNWLLSCGEGGVDFFSLIYRWNMKDRQEIGDLIYSISADYIERRIMCRRHRPAEHISNQTYHGQDLATKFDVLRHTLHILGLSDQFTRKLAWLTDHFSLYSLNDGSPKRELTLRQFSSMLQHVDKSTTHHCKHIRLQPSEITASFSLCVRCHLYDVVREVAYCVCCLVFSDWYLGYRKVSQRRVLTGSDQLAQSAYQYFEYVCSNEIANGLSPPSSHAVDHVGLASELATICSESTYALDLIRSNQHKFLGLCVDGMLMVNYRAIESSLRPGPTYVLRDGQFSFQGEQRSLLVASPHHGSSSFDCEVEIKNSLTPFDHFPGMVLSVKASLQRDTIRMQHTVSYRSRGDSAGSMYLETDVPLLDICDGLDDLHLIPNRTHGSETPLQVSKVQLVSESSASYTNQRELLWRDSIGSLWQIRHNLRREDPSSLTPSLDRRTSRVFHLCPTKGNAVAQWASLALATSEVKNNPKRTLGSMYLQETVCLACISDHARALSIDHDICIICA